MSMVRVNIHFREFSLDDVHRKLEELVCRRKGEQVSLQKKQGQEEEKKGGGFVDRIREGQDAGTPGDPQDTGEEASRCRTPKLTKLGKSLPPPCFPTVQHSSQLRIGPGLLELLF